MKWKELNMLNLCELKEVNAYKIFISQFTFLYPQQILKICLWIIHSSFPPVNSPIKYKTWNWSSLKWFSWEKVEKFLVTSISDDSMENEDITQ
jgi:hypothetical protein